MDIKPYDKTILLGRQGENRAITVHITRDWPEKYGDGTFQLIHQRPGDMQPYPVSITQSGNTVSWEVLSSDTAIAGYGRAELQFRAGAVVVKSEIIQTQILPALGDAGDEPPEPYQSWVDEVLTAAQSVEESVEHYPYINSATYHWMAWSVENEEWYDTGVDGRGTPGEPGEPGAPGADGFSPIVTITEGEGERTLTIEDKEGEHSTTIYDGSDATVTAEAIEDALGFAPVSPTALALKADKTALADTDRRLGLLYDLTKGQAWRTEQSTTEAYSKVVPSGAHAAELESIGGKSAMVGDSPVHADVDRMEIYGKNYFNPDDYYNLYTNREYNIGGYATKAIHLLPNTTYTVSIHAAAAKSAPAFLINVQSYVSKEPYCDLRKVYDTRTYTTGDDGNLYIGTNGIDAPTNKRLAEIEIQIEIGSAATAYSPYHAPTEYPIPAAVRALEGYGQSEVGGQGNTVDFSHGIYTEYGHYEDGAWVSEDTPVVTDISGYLDGFEPLMDVEGGGALTFHQSGGTELAVPNSETYYINIAEALT